MNDERETAKKITAYLDRGSAELKSGTAYRLQVARPSSRWRVPEVLPEARASGIS